MSEIIREALTSRTHRKMFPSLKLLTAKQFFWDNRNWSLSDDVYTKLGIIRKFSKNILDSILLKSILATALKTYLIDKFSQFNEMENLEEIDRLTMNRMTPESQKRGHLTRALNALLNQDVADFTYPYYLHVEEFPLPKTTQINPWWKKMSPGLKKLVCIDAEVHYQNDFLQYIGPYLTSHQQNHLQVLELSEYFADDSILCLLAKHLPNLR
jgi:hypothetical protein